MLTAVKNIGYGVMLGYSTSNIERNKGVLDVSGFIFDGLNTNQSNGLTRRSLGVLNAVTLLANVVRMSFLRTTLVAGVGYAATQGLFYAAEKTGNETVKKFAKIGYDWMPTLLKMANLGLTAYMIFTGSAVFGVAILLSYAMSELAGRGVLPDVLNTCMNNYVGNGITQVATSLITMPALFKLLPVGAIAWVVCKD